MTWSQQEYIDAIKEALDAVGSTRWGDLVIKNTATAVFRDEWAKILRQNPGYRSAVREAAVSDAFGFILIESYLDLFPNADTGEIFYRVLGRRIWQNDTPYERASPLERNAALAHVKTGSTALGGTITPWTGPNRWYQGWSSGSEQRVLQVVPVPPLNTLFRVPIVHRPVDFNKLANPVSQVPGWPEGHEMVVVFATAALLFPKGNAESDGAANFSVIAGALRAAMMDEISNISTAPPDIEAMDRPEEWGG